MTTVPSQSPCVPRTPKQQDRVARMLQAARQAFSQKSFHEVLMDDVAREAGVGKGTIYRYFPDKENLYFAVIFDGIESLRSRIRAMLPVQSNVEETIRDLVQILVTFFSQNRFFFRLMNIEDSKVGGESKPNRRRWHRERSELVDAIVQTLERTRDNAAAHIPYPRTDAQILLGMVRGILRTNPDELSISQTTEEIVRIYLHGILCPGASSASFNPSV